MLPRWSRAALAALTLAALGACDDDDDLQARERYEIPGDNVFPEGIGTDPDGRTFYVGSTTSGAIYRAGLEDSRAEEFLAGGADGRTDVRGIKVAPNGRLYAAGGGTGQVHVYDTRSRALLARLASNVPAGQSFVNDLAITPSGDVYATDSREPVIYRIPANASGQGGLERWLELDGTDINFTTELTDFDLNGIVSTADGRYLLTVQTSRDGRLYRITLADRTVTEVDLGGARLPGDGLLLDGRTLWAVTRQGTVGSVVRLQLSEDFSSATVESTTGSSAFDFPTTLARAGDRLLVVNSQLNRRSATPPQAPTLPFTITGIPVP